MLAKNSIVLSSNSYFIEFVDFIESFDVLVIFRNVTQRFGSSPRMPYSPSLSPSVPGSKSPTASPPPRSPRHSTPWETIGFKVNYYYNNNNNNYN